MTADHNARSSVSSEGRATHFEDWGRRVSAAKRRAAGQRLSRSPNNGHRCVSSQGDGRSSCHNLATSSQSLAIEHELRLGVGRVRGTSDDDER